MSLLEGDKGEGTTAKLFIACTCGAIASASSKVPPKLDRRCLCRPYHCSLDVFTISGPPMVHHVPYRCAGFAALSCGLQQRRGMRRAAWQSAT